MASKNAYHLINPLIIGSQNQIYYTKNSRSAGKKIYHQLSEYFSNHVEEFFMTVMNVETKELTHFRVKEKRNGNEAVDFLMEILPSKMPKDIESSLIEKATKTEKQYGGKHRDDDDSSSSSSSSSEEYFSVIPITRFIYFNLPYYKLVGVSPNDFKRVFLPTISLPLSPVIEYNFDVYKF